MLVITLLLAGCASRAPDVPVREFTLRGEVLRLDTAQRTATIRHGKIEGWMEAMTMEFPVRKGEDLDKLRPGNHIEATVYVTGVLFEIGSVRKDSTR